MNFTPITKTRLSQFAVQQIKDYIQSEQLHPGDKLPSERALMQKFSISRRTVREALRILEAMNFIQVKAGFGSVVINAEFGGNASMPSLPPPPAELELSQKKTTQQRFEARLILEPEITALAATRRTETSLADLRTTITEIEKKIEKADLVEVVMADVNFHRHIAQATENIPLMEMMELIIRNLYEGWRNIFRTPIAPSPYLIEHEKVFIAIEQGNPDQAREAMKTHLGNAQQRYLSCVY